jgi:hypothetical protein
MGRGVSHEQETPSEKACPTGCDTENSEVIMSKATQSPVGSRPYYDRVTVGLGMFGETAECLLVDWQGFGGFTKRQWVAHIRTGMNNCDGWGDSPEAAVRDALEGAISSKAAALAELRLFLDAKEWPARTGKDRGGQP